MWSMIYVYVSILYIPSNILYTFNCSYTVCIARVCIAHCWLHAIVHIWMYYSKIPIFCMFPLCLPLPRPSAPTSPFLSRHGPPGGDHFTANWGRRRVTSERRWAVCKEPLGHACWSSHMHICWACYATLVRYMFLLFAAPQLLGTCTVFNVLEYCLCISVRSGCVHSSCFLCHLQPCSS